MEKVRALAKTAFPLFFLFLSGSLTLAFFITQTITPFSIKLAKKSRSPESIPLFYHDFQDDGNSEYIQIVQDLDQSFTGILLHQADGRHIQQFNFQGFCTFQNMSGRKWLHIADYNGDHIDDLFVFHKWQNTLYLALVDVATLTIKWDVPIATAPSNQIKSWDVYVNDIQFVSLENHAQPLLLFSLVTGQAHQPRGLYAFDINQRKIVRQYATAISIVGFQVCDIDGNGTKEILLHTYASQNYSPDAPLPNDNYSWFIILDHQLKPLFKPKQLGPYTSHAHTFSCIQPEMPQKIITVFQYGGTEPFTSRIIKWNLKGERLKDLPLYYYKSLETYVFPQIKNRFYIFARLPERKLLSFNGNLEKLSEFSFEGTFLTLEPFQATPDSVFLVMAKASGIYILDANLTLQARAPMPDSYLLLRSPFITLIRKTSLAFPLISVSDGNVQYQYRFQRNPYYIYRPVIFIALTSIFLLLAYSLKTAAIVLFAAVGYLIATLKNNPNATLILRPDGRIVYHNNRFLNLLEANASNGKKTIKWLEKTHPQLHQKILSMLNSHQRCEEQVLIMFHGREHMLALQTIPFKFFRKPVIYYVEIQENVAFPLSERMKLWAAALQRLAHDIKNPLSSVTFTLRATQQRVQQIDIPDEHKEFLLEMLRTQVDAVEIILTRTQNFLKVSDIIHPQFLKHDLHAVLQKSVENYSKFFDGDSLQLITSFDESIPEICCDRDQLEVVFNILIENALDAMKGNGQLTITTLFQEDVVETSQYVEITFADTGRGIPPEIQEQLFKRKVSTKKEKGSGIGLLLVRNIVDMHGGTIHFKSSNNGTVFVIILPITQDCEDSHEHL